MTYAIRTTFTGPNDKLYNADGSYFNSQWINMAVQQEMFATMAGLLYHEEEKGVGFFNHQMIFDTEVNAIASGLMNKFVDRPSLFTNRGAYRSYMIANNITVVTELLPVA